MIVVDVSVVAYLLIEGEHTPAAEALYRTDPEWAAPLVWRSEWRSVLRGYLRRGHLTLAGALERTGAAQRLTRGREYPVDDALVLELMSESTCSATSCEYLALAETLDVPLVTNDREVLEAFPKRAVSPSAHVRAVGAVSAAAAATAAAVARP
ncbi:MAG: type II toxin-antitoxin system VapC family toxin [Gemmatimonadales bacterium]